MSEPQRAEIRARCEDYAFKATLLAEMTRDAAERNALRKFGECFREAAAELDRLARERDAAQQYRRDHEGCLEAEAAQFHDALDQALDRAERAERERDEARTEVYQLRGMVEQATPERARTLRNYISHELEVICGCGQQMVPAIDGPDEVLWICENDGCKPGQVNTARKKSATLPSPERAPETRWTDAELASFFLWRLWRWYDAGGTSHGRGYECTMLEQARGLLRLSLPAERDAVSDEEAIAEVRRRKHEPMLGEEANCQVCREHAPGYHAVHPQAVAAAPGGWQPIETAPKDGTTIIGALIRDGLVWRVHDMKHNGLAFYTSAGGSLPQMTHWMPLPPSPGSPPASPGEETSKLATKRPLPPFPGE